MSVIVRLGALAAVFSCACAVAAPSAASARSSSDPRGARTASAIPKSVARLLPRANLSFDAWNTEHDTYSNAYVNPRTWAIQLNGCGSVVDGETIGPLSSRPSPSWILEPLDGQALNGQPVAAISVPAKPGPGTCMRRINLQALGRWRITATVSDAAGVPASVVTEMTFRDVLIAAVGDSFTSGEGGKTRHGNWADKQCDRGFNAWPALLAREMIENGSITVTYLNFACSGAEVTQLTRDTYEGINPPKSRFEPIPLEPQLQALRHAVGNPLNPATRTVDLLVANVGINEMGGTGVADILTACGITLTEFVTRVGVDCRQDLSSDIDRLSDLYDSVELAASSRLRLGRAHVVGYPARIFTNSNDKLAGCGAFQSLHGGELDWIYDTITSINREMALAALRNGWQFTTVTDIFRGHGYCSPGPGTPGALPSFTSWFMTPSKSLWRQGNFNGSAHPNKSGHRATARRVRKAVRLDVPAPPPTRLTVRFLRVRVSHRGKLGWTKTLHLRVGDYESACGNDQRALNLTLNKWKDVSDDPCSTYDIRTVGRTIGVSGLTFLFKPSPRKPEPRVPPGGQPARAAKADPDFYFAVRRLNRRRDGWDVATRTGPGCAVQHAVGRRKSGKRGDRHRVTLEFDYEISTDQCTLPVPASP